MILDKERGATYDAEFGWRALPNVTKSGGQWGLNEPASTNSRGWRDVEIPFERSIGEQRIVAVGNSFTFGVSVDRADRFTEIIETNNPNVEVVNLGLSGSGTDQQLRILELEGLRYQPDVVVHMVYLGNDLNDIRHMKRWGWPKPYYRVAGDTLELVKPKITWRVRLRGELYLGEFLFRVIDNYGSPHLLAPEWSVPERDSVPLFVELSRRMFDVALTNGAHYLVVLFNNREHDSQGRTKIANRIGEELKKSGIAHIDLSSLISARVKEGEKLFARDGIHWSEAGHKLAAQRISDELLVRNWLTRKTVD